MGQQTRWRRQGSLTFPNAGTFGQQQTFVLGKGMCYRELYLRLSGSLTYGAGINNAAATLARGDEWSILENIQVVANGSDVIRSFKGHELVEINRMLYGTLPRRSATMGDGATVSPTFDSTLIIPFAMPDTDFPMDTLLDSSLLSELRVDVTCANSAQINSANGPTAISAALEFSSFESFGLKSKNGFTQFNMFPLRNVVSGANTEYQVQLPVSSAYRGFIINAAASAAATAADNATAITNVKLKSGTLTFLDIPWNTLRDSYRQRRGMAREYTGSSVSANTILGSFLNGARNTNRNEDAWCFVDLAQYGYLSETIDAMGLTELTLEFNVSTGCTISVIPLQLNPSRTPG